MKKLFKSFKSKWWDLLPFVCFLIIASAEGKAYWLGGILSVVWLFIIVNRFIEK